MKIFTVCFLISIYSLSCTQTTKEDTSATCLAKWKKGEEKTILISRTKKRFPPSEKFPVFNLTYEAHILVLDSSKDGYTIKWVFHLPEEFKISNPGLAELLPVYEGLQMIFTTTPAGVFKELMNWKEVKDAYIAMMEVSLPKNMDDSTRAIINRSNELFNSREMAEGTLIPEIRLYHAPYGNQFTTKETKSDTSLVDVNLFGGEPVPAIAIQKIKEINSRKDYLDATISVQLDSVDAYKVVLGFLKKMNIPEDSDIVKAKEMLSGFQVTVHNEYRIKRSTGWIISLRSEKTGGASQLKQTETFVYKMK